MLWDVGHATTCRTGILNCVPAVPLPFHLSAYGLQRTAEDGPGFEPLLFMWDPGIKFLVLGTQLQPATVMVIVDFCGLNQ